MVKKFMPLLHTVVVAIMLVGCGGAKADEVKKETKDQPVVMKLDHSNGDTTIDGKMTIEFARLVDQKTKGKVKIQLYHNGALCGGNQNALVDLVATNTVEVALVSSSVYGNIVPETLLINLPFFYKNIDEVTKIFQGTIGDQINKKFEPKGIKILAWGPRSGRQLSNSKQPVQKPDDIKGLKIRVIDNKLYVDSMQALGAQPAPMAWGEVYTGLQLKTIDGQENPLDILKDTKVFEVQKYVTIWDYSFDGLVLMMNNKLFNAFSPDIQKAIMDSAKETAQYQRKLIDSGLVETTNFLKNKGLIFYTLTGAEKAAFKEKTAPIWTKYAPQIGEQLLKDTRKALDGK